MRPRPKPETRTQVPSQKLGTCALAGVWAWASFDQWLSRCPAPSAARSVRERWSRRSPLLQLRPGVAGGARAPGRRAGSRSREAKWRLSGSGAVSYTHLTLPTICSV
eukprot:9954348-Alexandrium_andersonii.AAC.1